MVEKTTKSNITTNGRRLRKNANSLIADDSTKTKRKNIYKDPEAMRKHLERAHAKVSYSGHEEIPEDDTSNKKQEHYLETASKTAKEVFNTTLEPLSSVTGPVKSFLDKELANLKNSNLRDKIFTALGIMAAVATIKSFIETVTASRSTNKLSSGAAVTSLGILANMGRQLFKINTNKGFKSDKEKKDIYNSLKFQVGALVGLNVFQQFHTNEGRGQALFNQKFKEDTMSIFSWLKYLNPINITKEIVGGNTLKSARRELYQGLKVM
ncbi:MAG: hypothetical protein MK033_10045 [Candidatus Caenarcaniphilales bacterium]|nr:hypothetical protein [Candidatus Caenarcaniphilales bacterium]